MKTKNRPSERRLRVIVSLSGDAESPRVFEMNAAGSELGLSRAVDAGAAWFGVAFNETLRRACQREGQQEGQQAA
jgi:hypothetical protein